MVRLRFLGCFCKFSHDDKPKRVQLSTHMRALHLGWDKQMMKRTKRWTNRLTMAPKNMYTTYEWIMCLCALLASLVYLSMLKRYARVRALHSIFAVLFILFADWIAAACCGFHCGVLHRTGVLLTGIPRAMIVFHFFFCSFKSFLFLFLFCLLVVRLLLLFHLLHICKCKKMMRTEQQHKQKNSTSRYRMIMTAAATVDRENMTHCRFIHSDDLEHATAIANFVCVCDRSRMRTVHW